MILKKFSYVFPKNYILKHAASSPPNRTFKRPIDHRPRSSKFDKNFLFSLSCLHWANIAGFLKEKNSLLIYERHGNLKYKYGNRSFWSKIYYVGTVGKNVKKVEEYIRN